MKCNVIGHEFKTAENGNLLCKLEVKPANDEWAASFNYVMFITEAMQAALEAKFPQFIYLQEVRKPTPEPFYRIWATDGPNYVQGEFVSRPSKDPNGEPEAVVFNDIKVVIRTMPDGTPARGEDADKLLQSQWTRGIANGTIIPVSYYGDAEQSNNTGQQTGGADPFAGGTTADPDAENGSNDPAQTANAAQQGNNTGHRGITVPGRPR